MGMAAFLLPSFPRKRESRTVLPYDAASLANHRGIPACAGMTVGADGKDSRKGRKDGRIAGIKGNAAPPPLPPAFSLVL